MNGREFFEPREPAATYGPWQKISDDPRQLLTQPRLDRLFNQCAPPPLQQPRIRLCETLRAIVRKKLPYFLQGDYESDRDKVRWMLELQRKQAERNA